MVRVCGCLAQRLCGHSANLSQFEASQTLAKPCQAVPAGPHGLRRQVPVFIEPSTLAHGLFQVLRTAKLASPAVQTMAQVMHDLQHNVTPADKVKLEAIMANPKASAQEKELASIIMGFMHNADDATKARLAKIH